jgi:GT2 family glycosyltransferase
MGFHGYDSFTAAIFSRLLVLPSSVGPVTTAPVTTSPVTTAPLTTVVVVTWRGEKHLANCLDALKAQVRQEQGHQTRARQESHAHKVLVIDNASDDGTRKVLAQYLEPGNLSSHGVSDIRVLRLNRNLGYAGALETALPLVETPFMAWLNDDTEPDPHWLATLETALSANDETAIVGSHLIRPDGSVHSTGVMLSEDGHGIDVHVPGPTFSFCGGAALTRTEVMRKIGGIPGAFFCYYEDTDTGWRARLAGWDIAIEPGAKVVHRHGASTGLDSVRFHLWNERNRLLMLLRCAPLTIAAAQLLRFGALTAVLPFRARRPVASNFRLSLRLRVLGEVLARVPVTLRQRRQIRRRSTVDRGELWRTWAGHYAVDRTFW